MDLSGKISIKARYRNDVRRVLLNNDELTFSELLIMLQRIFDGPERLNAVDNLVVKYKDEDGDLVTIANDADLSVALLLNQNLNIYIFKADEDTYEFPETARMLATLRKLRLEVDNLLDITAGYKTLSINDSVTNLKVDSRDEISAEMPVTDEARDNEYGHVSAKEFDPLSVNESKTDIHLDSNAFDGYPKVIKHGFISTANNINETGIKQNEQMQATTEKSQGNSNTAQPSFAPGFGYNDVPSFAGSWPHGENSGAAAAANFNMLMASGNFPQRNIGMPETSAMTTCAAENVSRKDVPSNFERRTAQDFPPPTSASAPPPAAATMAQVNPPFANAPLQFSAPFDPNRHNENIPVNPHQAHPDPSAFSQTPYAAAPYGRNSAFPTPNVPSRFQPVRPTVYDPRSFMHGTAPPEQMNTAVNPGIPYMLSPNQQPPFSPVSMNQSYNPMSGGGPSFSERNA